MGKPTPRSPSFPNMNLFKTFALGLLLVVVVVCSADSTVDQQSPWGTPDLDFDEVPSTDSESRRLTSLQRGTGVLIEDDIEGDSINRKDSQLHITETYEVQTPKWPTSSLKH